MGSAGAPGRRDRPGCPGPAAPRGRRSCTLACQRFYRELCQTPTKGGACGLASGVSPAPLERPPPLLRAPATRDQADAYRFGLRRMEAALVRGDPVPLHEQIRSQRRAALAGVVLGLLGLCGAAVWAVLVPSPDWRREAVVIGATSGAMYAVAHDPDRLVPVADLPAARLVLAALRSGGSLGRISRWRSAEVTPDGHCHGRAGRVPRGGATHSRRGGARGGGRHARGDGAGELGGVRRGRRRGRAGRHHRDRRRRGAAAPRRRGAPGRARATPRGWSLAVCGTGSTTEMARLAPVPACEQGATGGDRRVDLGAAGGAAAGHARRSAPRRPGATPGLPGRVGDVLTATIGDGQQYFVVLDGGLQEVPRAVADLLVVASAAREVRSVGPTCWARPRSSTRCPSRDGPTARCGSSSRRRRRSRAGRGPRTGPTALRGSAATCRWPRASRR